MKRGIFTRYFLGAALIITVSLGIMLLLIFLTYSNHLAQEKQGELKSACNSVSRFLEDSKESGETKVLNAAHFVMANISGLLNCDVYITDKSGAIVACSCDGWEESFACEHIGSSINLKDLEKISSGKELFGTAGFYSEPRYVAATVIKADGKEVGYVFAGASSESIKPLLRNSLKIYVLASLLPLAIMIAALYFMTWRINKPLRLMSEAAKAMAKGDFSKRIPVTSDDEIGELAASFNGMTNSLARLEETRKSFIANVSHEMRTPMTTIGGFIDGIIDGTIEPEKQEYYLNIVSSEIKRLSRMVQSMLSLARLESSEFVLKREPFDFRGQILGIVIGQERRIEEKQIDIRGLDG
ncbi:MAG: HAMP domain-containing histidine kinase, partial [Clostridia bacterium]|nr:HAMP domain-containing histidine kinase [Clostridia bacterium]